VLSYLQALDTLGSTLFGCYPMGVMAQSGERRRAEAGWRAVYYDWRHLVIIMA
jgi:hypothetical protein